jgi:hypothetical protein
MSSLPFPCCFQSQTQLDLVRRLLGWTAPEHVRKIRAGKTPLRDLAAREFVLFNSYAMCGLVPPISSFFLLLLEEFGLQLHHLTPHSVLLVVVFAHFMEMFVGVRPCTTIFRHFYALVGSGRGWRWSATGSPTGSTAWGTASSPSPPRYIGERVKLVLERELLQE